MVQIGDVDEIHAEPSVLEERHDDSDEPRPEPQPAPRPEREFIPARLPYFG